MNRLIIIISVGFVMVMSIATAMLVAEGSKSTVAEDLASACPKTYENDLLEFQYPCNWLLVSDNDGSLVFTEFHRPGSTFEQYVWIRSDAEGFSECVDGEYFSEHKLTIPSIDGQELEACYHGEHAGERLTIRSDNAETGFISISTERVGLESIIIPSLTVK